MYVVFGNFSGMYFAILLTLECKKNTPSVFHLSPWRAAPLSGWNHKQELQVHSPSSSSKKKREGAHTEKTHQQTQANLSQW